MEVEREEKEREKERNHLTRQDDNVVLLLAYGVRAFEEGDKRQVEAGRKNDNSKSFDELDLPSPRAPPFIVVFVIRVDIIISSLIFVLFFLVFVVVVCPRNEVKRVLGRP